MQTSARKKTNVLLLVYHNPKKQKSLAFSGNYVCRIKFGSLNYSANAIE